MNNGYASIDLNGQTIGLKFGMACFTEMMSKPLPDRGEEKVGTLVKAIESDTLTKDQRDGAIKELQSLNPDYFSGLKEEAGLVDNLKVAYQAYVSSTILGNLEYAADLIFAAYKNNCLVKREAPSLDYQPFYDFVEDASVDAGKMDVITGLMTIFTESKFVKPEPVKPQEAAATKKKNGQQTTLKPSVMVS